MSMTLVQTVTVGSGGAGSITFSNIPQDATDLVVLFSSRQSGAAPSCLLVLNGSSSSFSYRFLGGDGGSPQNGTASNNVLSAISSISTNTASTFANAAIYFPNYTTAANKSYSVDAVTENNAATAFQRIIAGLWSNTAAITTLEIQAWSGQTFVEFTSASLYKVTKA